MKSSRRAFLGGLVAAALTTRASGVERDFGPCRLRFGVLSDLHVDPNSPTGLQRFVRALEYFRTRGIDALVLGGDNVMGGRISGLKKLADAWWSVFPNDRADDGRAVARVFALGNHEYDCSRADRQANNPDCIALPGNLDRGWKEVFGEPWAPVQKVTVRGYDFIVAHWGGLEKNLPAWMAENGPALAKDRPFFLVQHPHPGGTCFGDWGWGNDGGLTKKVLADYPNAVVFSGHSHYSVADELSVWQGEFTSLNAGSLFQASDEYNFRDNARGNARGNSRSMGWPDWRNTNRFATSGAGGTPSGLYCEVYDGVLKVERRAFPSTERLGDDWILGVPARGAESDYAPEARRRRRVAPAFADGVVAKAEFVRARVRKPRDGEPAEQPAVRVSFPGAEMRDGCRVFDYEVTPILCEDDVETRLASRRIFAADALGPQRPPETCGAFLHFALDELPKKAKVRFAVCPVERFGRRGPEIFSNEIRTAIVQ